MLLLSVSTKKRKHNWEITKRDLTKLTSPSVRTKNDWSRRASAQKIGYLNSRTLRSVRLFFFSPSPDVLSRSHPRGFPALTLPMLTALEKHERSPLTIFRSGSHDAYVHASSHASPPLQFVPLLRGLPSAASAQHILPRRTSSRRRSPGVPSSPFADGTRKNATLTTGESVA